MKTKKSKVQEYTVIESLVNKYSVALLCKIAGVSRSGYYKWLKRKNYWTPKQQENIEIQRKIMECHHKLHGIYGYPRMKVWLRQTYGININHKRVYRLMKEMGIQAHIRRKKRYFGRKNPVVIGSNLLNRNFQTSNPNKKWATDITYLQFNHQRLYLSVICDLFNNEVVAYKVSARNDLKLVMDTVKTAIKRRDINGVLLHSDQGYQYTSRRYHDLLKKYNITASMSRKGNCLDNACIESFFSHLKSELMYLRSFKTADEVKQAIDRYIHFYNNNRFQAKLNNLSPVQYRTKVS
ncbi:IS3 family transposase [Laceyella putida]|uniref:IS3 family transposase n=1 Tax=Laceyella putida TaxID=110101 RepID=A0ABW2RM96_9BACL